MNQYHDLPLFETENVIKNIMNRNDWIILKSIGSDLYNLITMIVQVWCLLHNIICMLQNGLEIAFIYQIRTPLYQQKFP